METVNFGLNERRVDQDGQAYTFQEYLEFYGFQSGKTRWKSNSAERLVDAIVGRPESRAEQHGNINSDAPPVDITASSVSSVVKPDGFVPTRGPQTAPPEQHPSAKLIWSTDDMPTAAIKNRNNRHAKLMKALQQLL